MAANAGQSPLREAALNRPPPLGERAAVRLLRRLAAGRRRLRPTAGIGGLVELLFPPTCADCWCELASAGDGLLLCEACREALSADPHSRCPHCAARIADDLPPSKACAACRNLGFDF